MLKRRLIYFAVTALVLVSGYLSRQWSARGSFVHDYLGDAIWAAMIYFGFRLLLPGWKLKQSLLTALVSTYLIAISQLCQADWLNALRNTRLGALILGFVFLWSDILMYTLGILCAWAADHFFQRWLPADRSATAAAEPAD